MEQEQDFQQKQDISAHAEEERQPSRMKFWLLAMGIFLGSFLITSAVLFFNKEKGEELETEQKVVEKMIAADDKVEERIFYTKCQHLITQRDENQLYTGLNAADLERQGWQVTPKEEGAWWLYREEQVLCPEDADKRSIRKDDGKLRVYAGPTGTAGDVLFDLNYTDEMLPENWRQQLETGGIDFKDETILFSALESLDEFID